jgi:hypothetical protein
VFLPLNHISEACVKKEYTIRTFIEFTKVSAYKKMVCIVKNNLSLGIFLNNYFIISCEICTLICTKRVVMGSRKGN